MGRDTKEEAIYQSLVDRMKRDMTLVYLPGTMAHMKEQYKEDLDPSKGFVALIER
jgi:hypothetical protein